ncbi:MAG TPA: hypothetical protein VFZ91_03260 [Allosphingosinicella sp.]
MEQVRIVARIFSRELTPEEIDQVFGGEFEYDEVLGADCQGGGTWTTSGCSSRRDDADV